MHPALVLLSPQLPGPLPRGCFKRGRHHALASVYLINRRFDDCLAEFELALRLNPNFSPARGYYGVALAYCGRWQEGDRAARHALRLSPRDPFAAIYCGVAAYSQFVGRNYEEAMRLSREGLRHRADFVGAHRVLTAAAAAGRIRRHRKGGVERIAARAAEHFACVDCERNAVQARGGSGVLSGGIPAGGVEVGGTLR